MNEFTDKKYYSSIDFIKFVLVVGMMFRHAPLYLLDFRLVEYSLEPLTIYSFFIPVTSGFIFILGFTLGLGRDGDYDACKYRKNLQLATKLLLLSLSMGILTFYMRNEAQSFFDYYACYQYNTQGKPGFYILLPISMLYVFYSSVRFYLYQYLFPILLVSLLSILYVYYQYDFYWAYYLAFGLVGCLLSFLPKIGCFLNYKNIYVTIILLAAYFGTYLLNVGISMAVEFFLLLVFCMMFVVLGNSLSKYKHLLSVARYYSGEILIFYLIHVVALNVLSRYYSLNSWTQLTMFSIFAILMMAPIIYSFRKIVSKRVI